MCRTSRQPFRPTCVPCERIISSTVVLAEPPITLDAMIVFAVVDHEHILLDFVRFLCCQPLTHHANLHGRPLDVRRLLVPCDLFFARSPTDCKLSCRPVTNMWNLSVLHRTRVPTHRHVLQFHFEPFFGHVDIPLRGAAFRNYLFAERFSAEVCHVLLTFDSAYPQPWTWPHRPSTNTPHLRVSNLPIPCLWETVFGGLRIDGQHWFQHITKITQQRHHSF